MDDIWRIWATQNGQHRQQPSEDLGSLTVGSRMPEDTFPCERSVPGTMVVWSRPQESSHDGAALNNMLLENSPKMHDITGICVTGYFKGEQHGWPDSDTAPSEQEAHQQQLQPCPMILHVPLNPALRLNMLTSELAQTGRGMPAVQFHASKKQRTSRAFVLSLCCRDVPGSRSTAWTYDTEIAGREEARTTSTMSNTNSDARVGEIHDQTRTDYISRLE